MTFRSLKRFAAITAVVALGVTAMPKFAAAVDAPNWVAVIHVQAQNAVGLRWLPVAGATGYKVLRSSTAGSGHAEVGTSPAPQFFDRTIEPGETYYYVLQAVAGTEVSANSDERSINIPGQKVQKIQPPQWATVTPDAKTEFGKTSYRVGMKWNRPAQGKPIAYNIYRSETAGKDYAMMSSTSENQYLDATVEGGKTYYYVLTALDEMFMESAYSPEEKVEVKVVEKKAERKKRKKKVSLVPLHSKPVFVMDNNLQLLQQPRDIAVGNDGSVYVTDALAQKVLIFDRDGNFVSRFGETGKGAGQFMAPSGVTVGPDGDLYVADQENGQVHVFRTDGSFLRAIKLVKDPKHPSLPEPMPFSVTFLSDGNMYVTDYRNHQVQVFDDRGAFLFKFGTEYDDAGKPVEPMVLAYPVYITTTTDNKVAVTDSASHVTVFDAEGNQTAQFGERGASVGAFMYMSGITIEPERNWLFVVDKTVNSIQVFDTEGNFKYALSSEDGKGIMGVANPNGLQIVGNKVYVVENLSQRYSVYQILWDQSPPPYKDPDEQ